MLTDVFYMCSICWFGAMVWRNVQRTMLIDIAVMRPSLKTVICFGSLKKGCSLFKLASCPFHRVTRVALPASLAADIR